MFKKSKLDDFYSAVLQKKLCKNKRRLQCYLNYLFAEIDFNNLRVLDIGGGEGIYSFYAACMGAKEVICIEPEAAGGNQGMNQEFEKLNAKFGLSNKVVLKKTTIQLFEPGDKQFDVILLHNSINHLDETACMHLLEDEKHKKTYQTIFLKISSMLKPGAKLIICDCSRRNFFAFLKIKNPFAPTIEWYKHQTPKVWVSLLQEAGFCDPRIRWTQFYPIRGIPTNYKLASYFLNSHFCLTMRKA